ncbi:MAG TPA: nickel-dependent lactate racemase [Aggregatilineales bacterium]|nr:nickel-dependent lactate racemase [Aggregatilineales bacterium]HPV08008.1 nickel-dependent lactate racemase [Aggregatilineales bacterium]HQA69645.1 nickel-dependent lactate racemase [Aggregatilineales bacterium]HQE17427.1 nickel-dependent lactate racemase [Aggregatilineales bacterium]
MQVNLAYGRHGLTVTLPDTADVIRPRDVPGLPDEAQAIRDALRAPIDSPPLADLVRPGDTVCIVHTDITRATPNDRILPVLIDELEAAGVAPGDIFLLNGLGTHRPQTDAELRAMLGDRIVEGYRCLQHDCYDDANLVDLGVTSRGNPVRVNRDYLEADVKILTGFIEPHFFAGFSGGPKAILPSLAGIESVYTNHGLHMIADPRATWGITEGNPIWEEMREVALRTEPTFLLNVTLNTRREITGVFAGDMLAAHAAGCAFVRECAMAPVDGLYDIVITTNSGYPLDQNLYQSVKGMSAARQIVCKGGAIIIATACEDGLPDHGLYARLLREAGSPQAVLDTISQPGFAAQDQWQVQIQAQIQLHADVYVYSDNLTDEQIREALFIPTRSIEATVAELVERYRPGARICVMPEGPLTIPYVRETVAAGEVEA